MGTKVCYSCKLEKPVSEFSKKKAAKDGLNDRCKVCDKAMAKTWYEANKDRASATKKARYEANKERVLAKMKAYREANKERVSATKKARYEANKDHVAAAVKAWAQANPDKVNATRAYRRAAKLQATPSWADSEAIREFYECARAFKLYTGLEYHVDHIVPLQSKLVCGLHCEANLQVLDAKTNMSKHNKWWPDMP
jgi:hypothetical protein